MSDKCQSFIVLVVIPVNRGLVAECFLTAIKNCFVLNLIKAAVHLMCLATYVFVATSMVLSLNFPASRITLQKKKWLFVFSLPGTALRLSQKI